MKRSYLIFAAFAAVTLFTVAAQAAGNGEQIFKQKCAMCHVVSGKGGKIGPELTKLSSTMREDVIRQQLEEPKKKNPSSMMPSFKSLQKGEMDALLAYLKTLK